jgi:hypothetical protein
MLEAVISLRPEPTVYSKSQLMLEKSLQTAVRIVGGWCEMAASLGNSRELP